MPYQMHFSSSFSSLKQHNCIDTAALHTTSSWLGLSWAQHLHYEFPSPPGLSLLVNTLRRNARWWSLRMCTTPLSVPHWVVQAFQSAFTVSVSSIHSLKVTLLEMGCSSDFSDEISHNRTVSLGTRPRSKTNTSFLSSIVHACGCLTVSKLWKPGTALYITWSQDSVQLIRKLNTDTAAVQLYLYSAFNSQCVLVSSPAHRSLTIVPLHLVSLVRFSWFTVQSCVVFSFWHEVFINRNCFLFTTDWCHTQMKPYLFSEWLEQWRSYTRAHKGLGPGNFLSALVTFEILTSMLSS